MYLTCKKLQNLVTNLEGKNKAEQYQAKITWNVVRARMGEMFGAQDSYFKEGY